MGALAKFCSDLFALILGLSKFFMKTPFEEEQKKVDDVEALQADEKKVGRPSETFWRKRG